MRNSQVSQAWANGKPAKTANASTNGQNLYSYRLRIGYTNEQGEKVVLQYSTPSGNFVSATTSKHVSQANSYADVKEIPTQRANY